LKEEFVFGTYNPISENQYIKYKDDVFIVNGYFPKLHPMFQLSSLIRDPLRPMK